MFGAAALLPGAPLASPGTCAAADLDGCPPITDAAGEEGGPDGAALLQVSRLQDAELAPHAVEAGGDWKFPQMTIATWNLACFEKAKPSEIAATLAQLEVDVIGTQEDIEFNETSQDSALSIPGYTKVVACRGEALWDSEPAYAWGGRWLQNAIYIRDETVTWERSFTKNISNPEVVGDYLRCAAVADLRKNGCKRDLPVRVASVHLTGGRFVDSNFLSYNGEKGHEIREALAVRPDVLMGDFNSYNSKEQVEQFQQSYSPYTDAKENGQLNQYLGWTLEGTQEAARAGYVRIDNSENTTTYGGTVDHIYLRPEVGLKARSFRVLGGNLVGDFEQSDHNLAATGLIAY